ncbi:hypothetical protein [Clostridium aciditolerans]|uniref:Lipoprotein n=1 Tax=Clostridium aciditolerans TaxID=339861 RepID=A0A934M739_9CLOT|nr:hypothetical protein [Clostridium aciditolerans]MBI6873616.1 hypothetical protein [Clostridium aciditolerans]
MKRFTKRLTTVSMVVALLISVSGCSFGNKTSKTNNDTKQSSQNTQNNNGPKLEQDVKRTEQLKKEKEIIDGQVYVQSNMVTATMIIKDNVKESDGKALADKYAKDLKASYKDMKVNVQAVQKGKNIANITLEK